MNILFVGTTLESAVEELYKTVKRGSGTTLNKNGVVVLTDGNYLKAISVENLDKEDNDYHVVMLEGSLYMNFRIHERAFTHTTFMKIGTKKFYVAPQVQSF